MQAESVLQGSTQLLVPASHAAWDAGAVHGVRLAGTERAGPVSLDR